MKTRNEPAGAKKKRKGLHSVYRGPEEGQSLVYSHTCKVIMTRLEVNESGGWRGIYEPEQAGSLIS